MPLPVSIAHSVSPCIRSLGFRAIVANPAKARISSDPTSRNDRNDARGLARLALADPAILFPVRLRSESSQRMLP